MREELVRRARGGDQAAFERLAAASIDRLYAIAMRVLRDSAAAEDATQECLVRAWRDVRALRDPGRWDAWLYRLLLNACRDEQRRAGRRPTTIDVGAIDPADELDATSTIARRDELERGFRRLLGDGERTGITIGGAVGYRWAVPQRWYVGPLAGLAAFEWKGRFYVFQVHDPLDGAPGDVLGPVLAGVTLR